jgi:hypothetical protein
MCKPNQFYYKLQNQFTSADALPFSQSKGVATGLFSLGKL